MSYREKTIFELIEIEHNKILAFTQTPPDPESHDEWRSALVKTMGKLCAYIRILAVKAANLPLPGI